MAFPYPTRRLVAPGQFYTDFTSFPDAACNLVSMEDSNVAPERMAKAGWLYYARHLLAL
jgi:hypothetical protein